MANHKAARCLQLPRGPFPAGQVQIPLPHGWWDRFRQRHPHLTMRAWEALAYR